MRCMQRCRWTLIVKQSHCNTTRRNYTHGNSHAVRACDQSVHDFMIQPVAANNHNTVVLVEISHGVDPTARLLPACRDRFFQRNLMIKYTHENRTFASVNSGRTFAMFCTAFRFPPKGLMNTRSFLGRLAVRKNASMSFFKACNAASAPGMLWTRAFHLKPLLRLAK